MGHMPAPQQPIEIGPLPAPESVVEFGTPPEQRRRWSSTGFLHDLAADRRLVPIAASVAAVGVFASLVSEWQLTTVGRNVFGGDAGTVQIPTDTADLGVLGTGYLLGVFLVVPMMVLTMFGPPAVRRHARLIGLSVCGTLLGVVLSLVMSLGEQSRTFAGVYNTLEGAEGNVQVAYGRGLWCALAGVLFALLALALAGRHLPDRVAEPAAGEQTGDAPAEVWSWRRPPAGMADGGDPTVPEPLDLTVSPAKPFTSLTDDRDKPSRS
jgi:hypothetical protein